MWQKLTDESLEIAYTNGRQILYANKSSKHKGWIVSVSGPSDGFSITHPRVSGRTEAEKILKVLMSKSDEDFYDWYRSKVKGEDREY